MKVSLNSVGKSDPIKVNVHQNDFKVTLIGVADGFTGKSTGSFILRGGKVRLQ